MGSTETLLKAFTSGCANDTSASALNTRFRNALWQQAKAEQLPCTEDKAGNIYITKPGRDATLAGIALAFPLDGQESEAAFLSAFRAFNVLRSYDLLCDIILLGWTTIGARLVGREIWAASGLQEACGPLKEHLLKFDSGEEPSCKALSAIFNIVEVESKPLKMMGSPVLLELAKMFIDGRVVAESDGSNTRAPELQIVGKGAETIAISMVQGYSAYVGALFENFD